MSTPQTLDQRINALTPEVDEEIRTELQQVLRTLRQARYPVGAILAMSRVALRLFRIIYDAAGKPWPSDNLFDVIVRAARGDPEKKVPGYHIIPDALDSPLHMLRILSNRADHDGEQFQLGPESAESVLNAFLTVLRWFYCESPFGPSLVSPYVEATKERQEADITLTVDRDLDTYPEEEQQHLLTAIKALLRMNRPVKLVGVARGSVLLAIRLFRSEAEELLELVEAGKLAQYGVVRARIEAEAPAVLSTNEANARVESAGAEGPGERPTLRTDAALLPREEELQSSLVPTMYEQGTIYEPILLFGDAPNLPIPRPEPHRVGKYNLLRFIAVLGMGEVYEAEELAPDPSDPNRMVVVRRVALKRILPKYLQTHGAVERFSRETQAGKALDHPNIVPIYESGEVGGEHFFTMPYVWDPVLSLNITSIPLTPRQAARVVMQLAQAVAYAHQGPGMVVIHGDIQPENIVLQPTDWDHPADHDDSTLNFIPRLMDFGLARLVAEDSSLSIAQKGEAMGKPGYMSPEQAIGDIDSIGPASDIYGLGAVLYRLLAGKPPFPSDILDYRGNQSLVQAILKQVATLEPAPIRERNAAVPQELEDIWRKCLRKAPADRFESATQLAEALDDFLAGRPEIRHTPRTGGRSSLWWACLGAVVLTIAAAVIVFIIGLYFR
jgi:serine/threonine protein kinase